MTNQHPITPPSELVYQWIREATEPFYVFIQAAQWGADIELEACCKFIRSTPTIFAADSLLRDQRRSDDLYAARRPKPPTLKEQALKALHASVGLDEFPEQYDTIRRALETLDD